MRHVRCVFSHWTAVLSAEWRRRIPPSSLLTGQDSTICDIVSVSLQAHNSGDDSPHFFRQNAQRPWPVLNRFKVHQYLRGRLKPGTWTDYSRVIIRSWLTTDVVLQSWRQQWVMSTGCVLDHSGFRDFQPHLWGVEDVIMKWPVMILSSLWNTFVIGCLASCCSVEHWRGLCGLNETKPRHNIPPQNSIETMRMTAACWHLLSSWSLQALTVGCCNPLVSRLSWFGAVYSWNFCLTLCQVKLGCVTDVNHLSPLSTSELHLHCAYKIHWWQFWLGYFQWLWVWPWVTITTWSR